ncbi:dipeptide ABC transporter ATP-binding protein [Microbacterium resistens]|uniref:dipeptide ABC transporter ATP-binding protein n=1 Tax=Microbacterium resistens TaxID=156977 RepID=UPI000836198E|nr:ABC transporter ATP-binding protein [Microbacterium resistens]
MLALEVNGLTVVRESDDAALVEDVSFALEPGEVLGIVGESGSGKSTLALALLGYARHGARIAAGAVRIDGEDLLQMEPAILRRARGRSIAYVAQDPGTALNPALSIRTQLGEALGGANGDRIERIREVLRDVGLPDDDAFLRRRPAEMSGGQQQRIAIAMAVIARPRAIVLDEPTTGLDVATQARVLSLVSRLCESHAIAAIYVSHDLAVVAEVADQIMVMYGGQTVERAAAQRVLADPQHPYTRALLDAVPSTRSRMQLRPIPGRAPRPGETGGGCVFRARCAFATPDCATVPLLRESTPAHLVRCVRPGVAGSAAAPAVAERREHDLQSAPRALEVADLVASYGDREVLHDLSFTLVPGRCVAVVGESGSGKSTLSRCLIGLHREVRGSLVLDGAAVPWDAGRRAPEVRHRLQYVFQNPYASLNPRRNVERSLAAALPRGMGPRERRARIRAALDRVELAATTAHQYPADLSGGQRQRVAIARALIAEPTVLLCDEVTSALDVSVQASVIELLRGLIDEGLAALFVTHDLGVVRSIADDVLVMNEGTIVERGATDAVLTAPVHPYTRSLLENTLDLPEEAVGSPLPRAV